MAELGDWTAATCILQSFCSSVFEGVGREEGQPDKVREAEYGARFAGHSKAPG